MYEFFRISYSKIKFILSKVSSRRFLSFILTCSFAIFIFVHAPLKRFAFSQFSSDYNYIFPNFTHFTSFYDSATGLGNVDSSVSYGSGVATSVNNISYYYSTPTRWLSYTFDSYNTFSYPYYISSDTDICINLSSSFQNLNQVEKYNPTSAKVTFYLKVRSSTSSPITTYVSSKTYKFNDFSLASGTFFLSTSGSYLLDISFYNLSQLNITGLTYPFYLISFDYSIEYIWADPPTFTNSVSFLITDSFSSMFRYPSWDISVVVPGTPQTSQTVNDFLSQNNSMNSTIDSYDDIEKSYTDSFRSAESAVRSRFSGWTWGSILPAANWLSTQLTTSYNLFGDLRQFIVYPLLAGVGLVFLGRWGSVASSKRRHDKRKEE